MPENARTTRIELPEDWWPTYVYVNFGWLCCEDCEVEPDLLWIWDRVTAGGEEGVAQFTIGAVNHLKQLGWTIRDEGLCCPKCGSQAKS